MSEKKTIKPETTQPEMEKLTPLQEISKNGIDVGDLVEVKHVRQANDEDMIGMKGEVVMIVAFGPYPINYGVKLPKRETNRETNGGLIMSDNYYFEAKDLEVLNTEKSDEL